MLYEIFYKSKFNFVQQDCMGAICICSSNPSAEGQQLCTFY